MSQKQHNNKDERKMHAGIVIDLNEYRQSKLNLTSTLKSGNKMTRQKYEEIKQKIIMMAQKTNW